MKTFKFYIILAVLLCLRVTPAWAQTSYQEVATSKGKVILGLSREKALQSFGPPAARGEGLWYYKSPDEFFVSFSDQPTVLLFPDSVRGYVGIPLEFKVFLSFPDADIREITNEVELAFDQPSGAKISSPGVIMPKKTGRYSALAIYHDVLSNPLTLDINETEALDVKNKEKLIGIDLLPHRPTATPEGLIDFLALGTYFDSDLNRYTVRDIGQKAVWLMRLRPNLTWEQQEGSRVYFMEEPGKEAEVCVEHEGIKSYLQRVQIKMEPDPGGTKLKHLLVLPEVMTVILGNSFALRAFGTYYNNNIEELTQDVKWRVSNSEILEAHRNGYFFAKATGVTEIIATKDGVDSIAVKVVVTNKGGSALAASAVFGSGSGEDGNRPGAWYEIETDVDKLKKDLLVDKKKITSILVNPQLLEIGKGEEGKFTATGIYDDGSSTDLTVLGEWDTRNSAIATVASGNVSGISVGQTSAFVRFKGVRSDYAKIVVGGPRLVSLLLTPAALRLSRDGKAKLKVMGSYYDKSQREITESVNWKILGDKPCITIDKGSVAAVRFGQSDVIAEHSLLKSNPATISVVVTLGWLLWLLAKILLAILLIILIIMGGLYLAAESRRKYLRSLKDDPRRMIIELYENATQLVTIFGFPHNVYALPLHYAKQAQAKFALENNVFLNFSEKYEEAKYSKHILGVRDLVNVLNDYNNFFERLCKDERRGLALTRQCLALLYRRPIFIFSSSEVTA